jgi:hypothetical protein
MFAHLASSLMETGYLLDEVMDKIFNYLGAAVFGCVFSLKR